MNIREVASFFNHWIDQNEEISKFCADSRLLGKNDLFFALSGHQTDGHAYLEEAEEKGALAAVVKNDYTKKGLSLPLFKVEDPLKALHDLARDHLKKSSIPVIGITGSVGKTTTTHFITQLLKTKYKVASSKKNHNTKITLPLTLLNEVVGDEDFIVLEMGMTHPGDIERLVHIAPPSIGVLTEASFVHAVNFSSLEEIIRYKSDIFSSPLTKIGIAPLSLIPSLPPFPHIQWLSFTSVDSTLKERFKCPGDHNLRNLAAAVQCALCARMTPEEIGLAIPNLTLPEKRLEFVFKKGLCFINDSYNACWPSVKSAIDTLSTLPNPRKIAILGDMKELGKWSSEMHQKVLNHANNHLDTLLLLGPEWVPFLDPLKASPVPFSHFLSKKELFNRLKEIAHEGDAILIKGSNSHQLWTILEEF